MMTKRDGHIFLFIGEGAITLEELGPIADMPLSKGLQAILDAGMLGKEYVGVPWHEVIKSSGINVESAPEEDDIFLTPLYKKYKAELAHCEELSRQGQLTPEAKEQMLKARREYKTAKKLST